MTYQEALKSIVEDGINLGAGDFVGFEALILVKEALEKQILKKAVKKDNCGNKSCVERCPNCFEIVYGTYCQYCGQAIDRNKRGR